MNKRIGVLVLFALASTVFGSGLASAATTISTNIQTDGTLSVTGLSTFTGPLTTSGTTGGYQIDGNLILQASSTLNSVFIGQSAGNSNAVTGTDNDAFGLQALYSNTTGGRDNAIGYQALYSNTTGTYNNAFGLEALYSNTTGGNTVAFGHVALYSNTTGGSNVAVGYSSLFSNTTGTGNVAVGQNSGQSNGSATSTVSVGFLAGGGTSLFSNQGSVAIGYEAGRHFATGSDYNTLLGFQSGVSITTGNHNIVLGAEDTTPDGLTTGSGNIIIGNNTAALTATASNQLDIGNIIFGTGLSGTGSTIAGSVGVGVTNPTSEFQVASSTSNATLAVF
jgi:trimeric autotransporter adhesin